MSCRALFLGCLAVFFLVFVMIRPTVAFRMPSTRASHTLDGKRLLSMIDEDTNTNDVFTSLLSKEEYAAAFENIKSNPLTQVTFSQAIQMLNHLGNQIDYLGIAYTSYSHYTLLTPIPLLIYI